MDRIQTAASFDVDVFELGGTIPDLTPYKGIILGSPVLGMGLRRDEPGEAVENFVAQAQEIGEKKLALFTVCRAFPGKILLKMRELVEKQGSTVVVMQAYNYFRPEEDDHILPAECMIRIR